MSLPESFKVASERLELAVNAVATVAGGQPLESSFAILSALQIDEERYGSIIYSALDELTALSDGPVKWKHGRGLSGLVRGRDATFPHVWSSAHQAALEISRLAQRFFLHPLELDDWGELPKDREPLFRKLLSKKRRDAPAISLQEVAELQERIRRERARLLVGQGWSEVKAADRLGVETESSGQPAEAEPVEMLTSWGEILTALKQKRDDLGKVKSLNDRYNGPIPKPAKGSQPIVRKDVLIEWWNKLAIQEQELANQREGAKLAAENQYNYGREGRAAPEIGGGVKKRRRDSKR